VFYNAATNFRVAPQRYTITGTTLPSETGKTRDYGVRFNLFDGRLDLRITRYETFADNASVSGLTAALNQLAQIVPQVVAHNYLGDNVDNPSGIAAFEGVVLERVVIGKHVVQAVAHIAGAVVIDAAPDGAVVIDAAPAGAA